MELANYESPSPITREEAVEGGMSLSVSRALSILALLGPERPDVGITEVSRELGLSKSIVHRLVRALEHHGFLERTSNSRRYRVGYGALQLGRLYIDAHAPEREALPIMRGLVASTGHSSQFGVLCGDVMVIAAAIEGPGPIKYAVPVGEHRLSHASAMGKAGLSALADDEVDAILSRCGMTPETPHSITDPLVLKADLSEARRRGYATNWEESHIGVGSVAAPVRNPYPGQVMAISLGFPTQIVKREELASLGEIVREAADRLSSMLSGDAGEKSSASSRADGPSGRAKGKRA